ncbi:MAG: putative HTH-type transcriptional regulator rutR, transcriptional regulator, TetR family, partial [Deinococcus sp.]|nr:putative HTH-type transcriptional regulator rutR, transcriptional regulator, TetR family [Deinococcus sp.]
LFASGGFAATGMQDIATAAGVARATPSYFFGSKEQLWQAVMELQGALVAGIVPAVLARLEPDSTPEALRDALLEGVLSFHQAHPEALRLIQWAELQGSSMVQFLPAHSAAVQSGLPLLGQLVPGLSPLEAAHLTLSLLGACYAHLSYGQTFGVPLGLNPDAPNFMEERRVHLRAVLRALLP